MCTNRFWITPKFHIIKRLQLLEYGNGSGLLYVCESGNNRIISGITSSWGNFQRSSNPIPPPTSTPSVSNSNSNSISNSNSNSGSSSSSLPSYTDYPSLANSALLCNVSLSTGNICVITHYVCSFQSFALYPNLCKMDYLR